MIEAALVIGGIGAVAAAGLGVAAKVFAVFVDPKVTELLEVLPGANCGGCGYAGCSAAAEAVAKGKAPPNVCVAGGNEVAQAVGQIMGLTVAEGGETALAELGCKYGMSEAHIHFLYDGVQDCRAAALVAGGGKQCSMGCLGLGTCVRACPFGALSMGEDGLPRVNEKLCTACGTCERVCPKGIMRVQQPSRRFTHVQTVDDCVAPCQSTCPAQIDIPAYIAAIARGDHLDALRIIKESNPLPLTCGRVCPHPCEAACRRGEVDEEININHLKRWAADYELNVLKDHVLPPVAAPTGKRVVIVGGGPSGLSCAYYLSRLGHKVTILEAMPKAGGMLRYGIPEYRLPKEILDFEIEGILKLGAELRLDTRLGRDVQLSDLAEEYDAVYLALGAWDSRRLGVPGEEEYAQVQSGTEFLIKRGLNEPTPVGKNVIIVGGGNTAMDCARTSWRLGAENVYLLYRRSRKEMPANDIEVHEGEREGIIYKFLAAPTKLVGEGGKLEGMEYLTMQLGEPDASGRRRPVPVPGSETTIPVDNVFAAIGQSPDLTCLDDDARGKRVDRTRWGSVSVQDGTGATSVPGVFSGGDGARGAATAVEAIRDGRFAARSIHLLVTGEEVAVPPTWHARPPKLSGVDAGVEFSKAERVKMPELDIEQRANNFDEVELGLTEQLAREEAERCLQCGLICYRGFRTRA
ncbi:MAG: FAD-dependent oxidoreductase [Pseudomonadota bacterium]